MDAIRAVLLEHWDPLGVMADPEWPRDEYDGYVGAIHGWLARGESIEAIVAHLCDLEATRMGLARPPGAARIPVARALKAIDLSMTPTR
jgi:hypothetical protein